MTDPLDTKPRWAGAPPICLKENLPAFLTREKMNTFHARNSPSCSILRTWFCDYCQHWHMATRAPDPTGASSGTGRGSKGDAS